MKKILYRNYHRDKAYLENEALFKNIFRKRFNIIRRYKKSPGIVLDIGASTGVMLDLFKESGWKTWGVEPSGSARHAKRKGHKIVNTFFENAKLPRSHFDLVIMNHTLEHLDDPLAILVKVKSLLKDGGIIFVDVPNAGGLGARILGSRWPYLTPDEHKQQFTKESLAKVFKDAGFKILHFESRSRIFEFANPILEYWQSLTAFKRRFFANIITLPYAICVTALNMGDSMSMVGRK